MNKERTNPGQGDHGVHVASLAHVGRLWTAYLEFEDDPRRPDSHRARLRFEPADPTSTEEPRRTAVIIIEPSYEQALAKVRGFDERQLVGLLRSVLPEDEADDDGAPGA